MQNIVSDLPDPTKYMYSKLSCLQKRSHKEILIEIVVTIHMMW